MTDSDAQGVLLAECYAPRSEMDSAAGLAGRVATASAELRAAGSEIDYLGAFVVPGDELAYHVFLAADAEVVRAVGTRAGLQVERILPSFAIGPAADGTRTRPTLAVAVEVDRPVGHAAREIGP